MDKKVYLLLIGAAKAVHLGAQSKTQSETQKFDFFATLGDFGSKLQLMSLDKKSSANTAQVHLSTSPESTEMLQLSSQNMNLNQIRNKSHVRRDDLNDDEVIDALSEAYNEKKQEEKAAKENEEVIQAQKMEPIDDTASLMDQYKKMQDEVKKEEAVKEAKRKKEEAIQLYKKQEEDAKRKKIEDEQRKKVEAELKKKKDEERSKMSDADQILDSISSRLAEKQLQLQQEQGKSIADVMESMHDKINQDEENKVLQKFFGDEDAEAKKKKEKEEKAKQQALAQEQEKIEQEKQAALDKER